MKWVVLVFLVLLAGGAAGQVQDRVGVEDLRFGNSWTRDIGNYEYNIKGITPINVQGYPFNADGTDLANDETAIQAAIDSAYSWGGGTVYLPAGTYYVGGQGAADSVDSWCLRLKSNVTIMGDGPGTVIKLFPQLGRDVLINSKYPQAHIFYSGARSWAYPTDASGAAQDDLVADGIVDYPNNLALQSYPSNVVIRDLTLDTDYENQPSGGTHNYSPINIWSATNVTVTNCVLKGGVAETAYFYSNHPDSSTTNIIFSDNIVEETGEWGVDALGVHFDRVDGVTCTGNVIKDVGLRGIGVGRSWNVVIDGNEIRRAYDVGIRVVGSHQVVVSNNVVWDANQYGIEVSNESAYESFGVLVQSNNIAVNEENGESGVFVKNSQRVSVLDNMVMYPHWDGDDKNSTYMGGVFVLQTDTTTSGDAWLRDIMISGNQFYNIDDVYEPDEVLGDSLKYAPAAIQVVDTLDLYATRPEAIMITNNFGNYMYEGIRIFNVDSVFADGNFFQGVVRSGLDTSNVEWMSGTNYFTYSAAGASGRDTTGTIDDMDFDSPEDDD